MTVKFAHAVFVSILGLVAFPSSADNPDYNPQRAHHTPEGFRNLYPFSRPDNQAVLAWQWHRLTSHNTDYKLDRIARQESDLTQIRTPIHPVQVTWIGHATMLIQVDGLNILTDPVFSDRVSPLQWTGPKRLIPLPLQLADLPHIDMVVISHNHYDHLDRNTISFLNQQAGGAPRVLVPLGVDRWMQGQDIRHVEKMDWWDNKTFSTPTGSSLKITFVPSHHWSKRNLAGDENETLWGGYVFEVRDKKIWFAGDTGYSPVFRQMGERFRGFDLSLIPVGAYEPRDFMHNQHINPEEAVLIHQETLSKRSMGIHWGTFDLSDERPDQPMDDLPEAARKRHLQPDAFILPVMGKTYPLPN